MIALDPDLQRLPIKEILIKTDKVLVTYQGKTLPSLFLLEEGERDKLIGMLRPLIEGKV